MTDKRNDKYFRKIVSEYYQTKVMIITLKVIFAYIAFQVINGIIN
jgi:hypothetical protein